MRFACLTGGAKAFPPHPPPPPPPTTANLVPPPPLHTSRAFTHLSTGFLTFPPHPTRACLAVRRLVPPQLPNAPSARLVVRNNHLAMRPPVRAGLP